MAGAQSFGRGEEYFIKGRVKTIGEQDGTITATVQGTRSYRVKLWIDDGELEFSCTCPIGAEGEFCKHCVAVGLGQRQGDLHKRAGKKQAAISMDDARAHLARQDKNTLVDILMEHAMEDERLRQRLFLKAAKKSSKGLNLAAYRSAIDEAVETHGFVYYRRAYDYSRGIEEVINTIEELLTEGHAAEVIELSEYALRSVEEAMASVDDSDGQMGDILARLQDLHLQACTKAKPDPEALARRLFAWETRTGYDTFYGAAESYAHVLGEKGLAVYRKLAQAEWDKFPTLDPGRDDPEKYGKRFRITHIMEALARQGGDVEAVVAVKKRDLSLAYHYLQIAETYKSAGKHESALEWAERGVKAFPQRTDSRLREFLAGEYHRRKRHEEAMALIWAEYTEASTLENYRKLKAHADRSKQSLSWREEALELLRNNIAAAKKETHRDRWGWSRSADHSELVRIFLWERDVETAWQEAKTGGCSNSLWLELAALREENHPDEALPIYQRQIAPTVEQKNNNAYREAVGFVRKVHELMLRLGCEGEFTDYLNQLRATHKAKRNLMKLLDQERF